jgi:cation diffusion facilitator family transporter
MMEQVEPSRDARMIRVLVAVLAANAAVAAAKLVYAELGGSLALRADGFHSLLDGLNNVVGLIVVRAAARPPDEGHPYGHRKFEVLASLGIGLAILGVALRTGYVALSALLSDRRPAIGAGAVGVALATLGVNIIVAILEHRAGRRLQSQLLIADARHTLSDVFVTIAVLVGIAGARAGFPQADAAAALAVLALLGYVSYGILRRAVAVLSDEAALSADQAGAVIRSLEGVRAVRRIRSRGTPPEVRVDLIVEVDPELTVARAHEVADRTEAAIIARFPDVAEVIVHVEPAAATKPVHRRSAAP